MSDDKPTPSAEATGANAMWGGRFASGPDAIMEAINASIGFDRRLAAQDVAGSRAHAAMLAAQGIITHEDRDQIDAGLITVLSEIEAGTFRFSTALEDIHMNVENRLRELIGPAAGRLHTARSRNDQVALDFRMWVRDQADAAIGGLTALIEALVGQAEAGADLPMPGFTHLQTAQPVTWGHHMMAYVEMFARDRSRFADARARMNECPLGAAALAGTGFPLDRHMTATALGFDRPTANSLDTVADRDFALEFLAAASICGTHLSRFAEELVIWSSAQFRFVALSDRFSEVVTLLSAGTNNQTTIGDADRGIAGDAIQTLTELMASDGTIMSQSNSLSSKVDDYQEDLEELDRRMSQIYERYLAQFTVMEQKVDQLNSTREYLKTALDNLPYSNKKD